MRFKRDYPKWCCPYCGKAVGYLGNLFAKWFGPGLHGCDFSNTQPDLPWVVDRDGRVRTDKDRPVVLKAGEHQS